MITRIVNGVTFQIPEDGDDDWAGYTTTTLQELVENMEEVYSLTRYGNAEAGSDCTAELNATVTAAGAGAYGGTVYIPAGFTIDGNTASRYQISTAVTIPSDVTVIFEHGAQLQKTGSGAITFNGPLIAPRCQILYDFTGPGTDITYGALVSPILQEWHGGTAADDYAVTLLRQSAAFQTVAAAGSTTIDFTNGYNVRLTLDTSIDTAITLSNPRDGERMMIKVIQGGSNTIDDIWPANVKWIDGRPTITTGAGAIDMITLVYDSTSDNYVGAYGQNAV